MNLADLVAFLVAFGVGLAIVALASGAASGQPDLPFDGEEVEPGNISVSHNDYDPDAGEMTLVIENSAGESKNVSIVSADGAVNDTVRVPAGGDVVHVVSLDAGESDRVILQVSGEDDDGGSVVVQTTAPEEYPVRFIASVVVFGAIVTAPFFAIAWWRGRL